MAELRTVFSGSCMAGMVNRYLQLSYPLPSVGVQFALRFFSDQTLDLVPISWPPITINTDDPYQLEIRFKSAQRGIYFTRLDTSAFTPFTRYYPRIPTSWALDFAANPAVGRKDQDVDLDLKVTAGGMIVGVASDAVFGGDPTLSTEYNGAVALSGSAEVHTWSYEFPFTVENHTYRLGLIVSGSLSPFPPANVLVSNNLTVSVTSVSQTTTTETIIVNARNASTGASVNGTVTLNGYQTFQTGQPFTITTSVRTCDPELRPPCRNERVFNDLTVTAPGYNPVTFIR